jgi:NUDIX domain
MLRIMARRKALYRGFFSMFSDPHSRKEVVQTTNAVAFLFADLKNRIVLLTSQARPAMRRRGNRYGHIIEVPAGRRDLKTSIKGLVVKEAREEVGKHITTKQVKLLNRGVPLASSPGCVTERIWLAYVETDLSSCLHPKNKSRTFGLAAHNEVITRHVVTFDELKRMTFEDMKTFALVQWFLREKT